jgi:hypothetical protein
MLRIDFRDLLKVPWKWKGLIITGTVLCLIIIMVVSFTMNLRAPKIYQATVSLSTDLNKNSEEIIKDPNVNLIKDQVVAARVIERLGLDKPPHRLNSETLIRMISVEPVAKTPFINITVKYTDSEKARDIANTVAASAVELNKELIEAEIGPYLERHQADLNYWETRIAKANQELLTSQEILEVSKLKKEVLLEEQKRIRLELLEIDRKLEEQNMRIEVVGKKLSQEKKMLVLSHSLSRDPITPITQGDSKEILNFSSSDFSEIQIKDEQINPLYKELEPKLIEAISQLEGLKIRKASLARDLEINERQLTDLQKELVQNEIRLMDAKKALQQAEEIHRRAWQYLEDALKVVAVKRGQILKVVNSASLSKNPLKSNYTIRNAGIVGMGFLILIILTFPLEYISRYKTKESVKSHQKGY